MMEDVFGFVDTDGVEAKLYLIKDKKKRLFEIDEMIISPLSFSADIFLYDKILAFGNEDTKLIKKEENCIEFSIYDKYGCIVSLAK